MDNLTKLHKLCEAHGLIRDNGSIKRGILAEITGYSPHAIRSWFKKGPSRRALTDNALIVIEHKLTN